MATEITSAVCARARQGARSLLGAASMQQLPSGDESLAMPFAQVAGRSRPLLRFKSHLNETNDESIHVPYADEEHILRWRTAMAPSVCTIQSLGLGYTYNLYPTPFMQSSAYGGVNPMYLDIRNLSVEPESGQEAFIGRWADRIAGVPLGRQADPGIGGPHYLTRWVEQRADTHYPFFADLPHHLLDQRRTIDLTIPTNGLWFHSNPRPLVMGRDEINGPGPLHIAKWFDGADFNMGLPVDINTEQQTYVNLRAELTQVEPETIRLTLRVQAVVVVGKMVDFYWAVPVTVPGTPINCMPSSLPGSGFGTDCRTSLAHSGLGSLECFCVCYGVNFNHCAQMDVSFDCLCQGGCPAGFPASYYPACNPDHARYLREVAICGSTTKTFDAAWPYGQNYTLGNLQAAFNFTTGIDEWLASKFNAVGSFAIANTDTTGLQATITGDAELLNPNHVLPPAIEGTSPLPATPIADCFPTLTLKEIHLTSLDGYWEWLKGEFFWMLTMQDVEATGGAGEPSYGPLFAKLLARKVPVATEWEALMFVCLLRMMWDNAGILRDALDSDNIRASTQMLNVPLRTDCFPGDEFTPPGMDPATGELVFGYGGPFGDGCNLFYYALNYPGCPADPTLPGWTCDYSAAFNRPSGLLAPTWDEYYPVEHCPTDCWRMLAQGSRSFKCEYACDAPPGSFEWCPVEPGGGWSSLCEMVTSLELSGVGIFPRFWIQKRPYLSIRIGIEGGFLRVRAHYLNYVLREMNCWWEGYGKHAMLMNDPNDRYPPTTTNFGEIEVGRGAKFRMPVGIYSGMFSGAGLPKALWTLMQSTPHLLCGCQPNDPAALDLCGNGNGLRIYL